MIIFLSLSTVLFASSQTEKDNKKYELGFLDAHVINIKIDSSIYKAKDDCIYKKGTLCNLYKVDIKVVYFYSPNTYLDSVYIKSMKYILVPSKYEDSLFKNKEYLITVFGTPSKMYLGFSNILHLNEPGRYRFYHREPFIMAIIKCRNKSKNRFEKIIKTRSVSQHP